MITIEELEQMIRDRGMTKAAFAEAIGTTKQVFHGWRKRGSINYAYLPAIAEVLDIDITALVSEENIASIEWRDAGERLPDEARKKLVQFIRSLDLPTCTTSNP